MHIEVHTTKLEPNACEGILVEYSTNSNGFRIYSPETRRVVESRNVGSLDTPSRLLVKLAVTKTTRLSTSTTQKSILGGLRDYKWKMNFSIIIPSEHINIDELAVNITKLEQLLVRIRDNTVQE